MWKVSPPKHEKQTLNQKHTKIMSTYFRPQCLYKGNGIDRLVILGSEVDLYIFLNRTLHVFNGMGVI